MSNKIIIIGGVAGGASAAARLRRNDEKAEIILFEKGEHISFANCGLPYYIGEVITEKEKLLVQTPENMKKRFNIDVRTKSEVLKILPDKKQVEVKNWSTGESYFENYDKLILSPGAEPFKPAINGVESERVFTLRNIPDTYKIKEFVDKFKPEKAVVVGAGFIGIEMVENLHSRGVNVTLVELADHVVGPLDFDMASIVHEHIVSKGVDLRLNTGVTGFEEKGNYLSVQLSDGSTIDAGMVILGIGVRPETKLAKDAGLKLGATGGILVDKNMRTSDPDIYAVGDAVEVTDLVSGQKALIPLAGPANKQGRIAANAICGIEDGFKGTQGTSILKVFDMVVATTGNNERQLKKNGFNYEKSFTHSASHAGYYPGAIPMSIKLLFDKNNGQLYGAQIVGYQGVDKRMDVLATALRAKLSVFDLQELELSYAPPFSSAKDPVNIAGYVASNIIKGDHKVFHWHDIEKLDFSKAVLVDVRTPMENQLGNIQNSINIPVDELRERLNELPKDKEIYVYCQVGLRGYIAYRILVQNGFTKVFNLSGGYKTYSSTVRKNDLKMEENNAQPKMDIDTQMPAEEKDVQVDINVDACGLQCPGPIMKVYQTIKSMQQGQIMKVTSTDPAFSADIKSWCLKTGNELLDLAFRDNNFTALIKKGKEKEDLPKSQSAKNGKTMVVFSNDLDKAIASFIIANGAAAMGRDVTMFFTFWGLNILRKPDKVNIKKNFLAKMFGMMMPRGSKKLSLSKMNMGGMGPKMIRYLMSKNNVDSLEDLIRQARENGVRLIACNMSMDIMGIRKEELIDGVEIGGVASFLGSVEESDMGLFI